MAATLVSVPFLGRDMVAPGAFVAAVGADGPKKHEIDPALLSRESPDEVIVFDSTGGALQDVAAVALTYERAEANERGLCLDLASSGTGD